MSNDLTPPVRGDFATLPEVMDAARTQIGDREAYIDADRRVTFAQWVDAADALAAELVARGVRPGDVVAIALPPSVDYAIAFGAIVRAGAIASGVNLRLGPRELAAIRERCRPVLVIREADDAARDRWAGLAAIERQELATLCQAPSLGARRPHRDATDPVVIIWTSGTTGLPKGAWFDHRAQRAAVRSAGVMAAPFDRRIVSTPFAHAGYMAKLWELTAWGVAVIVSPTPWTVEDTVRLIADEKVTVVGGVPTQWSKLLEFPGLDAVDLSSIRLGIAATAPAPPELVERVTNRLGCALVVRYAMTESPSITGTEPGDRPEILFRTVGKPQAGCEIEFRDDAGTVVADGHVGRIYVRTDIAMRGYWNDPESTAATVGPDGWLRSGDLGHRDPEGNVVLVGRADDMYIRGGYNVYPLEVENVLTEHPGVAQAGVIGVKAPVIGEIGVAFVVAADPSDPPDLETLRSWCRARLADYKAPDELRLVDALPLTSMLKVDKRALRALHGTMIPIARTAPRTTTVGGTS